MDTNTFYNEALKNKIIVDRSDIHNVTFSRLKIMRAPITSDDDDDFKYVQNMIDKGTPIDLELFHLETDEGRPESGFYIASCIRSLDQSAAIYFRHLDTEKQLSFQLKFSKEGSVSDSNSSSVSPDFNNLAYGGYTQWCGKWRGRRRRWRVCTGEDCGKGHGICFIYRF